MDVPGNIVSSELLYHSTIVRRITNRRVSTPPVKTKRLQLLSSQWEWEVWNEPLYHLYWRREQVLREPSGKSLRFVSIIKQNFVYKLRAGSFHSKNTTPINRSVEQWQYKFALWVVCCYRNVYCTVYWRSNLRSLLWHVRALGSLVTHNHGTT